MVSDRCNYFLIWAIFCTLLPPPPSLNSLKNHNFEYMKKKSGDIIILYMCTKNYDQMMYCSWDMVPDGCNYFSFWAIFCPFTPITAQIIKMFKKIKDKKTTGDIIILHKCTKNYDQMMYGSWYMVYDGWTYRWTVGKSDI